MTTEAQRVRKLSYPNDDALRMLTDLLSQVQSGFHPFPRPLSPEALEAVRKYNELRRTLDQDRPLSALAGIRPSRT
jgi:hypothetical protein